MNRLESRTDPLNRTERLTYDGNGNLNTVTDRKGQVTTHAYDAQNRRIRTDYADGASVTFTYDPAGNLLTATDSLTGTITRSYDARNRLTEEISAQGTVTYEYDPSGRRQALQTSGLPLVTYGYDASSRLTGITQGPQNATLTYDPSSRRASLVLPNGISVEYQYDLGSRLAAQIYRNASGVLGDLTYTYDANGNRTGTGGSWARSLLPTSVLSTTYDSSNEQLAFGAVTQTFDSNGNLLTQTNASGTSAYTWDARNRLAAVGGPNVIASFAYDALGRRTAKGINGQNTSFLYDGLDVVKETGGTGDASYLRTLSIDEALARTDGVDTVHFFADALGSTVALVNGDGAIPTTYTYSPFGDTAVTGLPGVNPFQFTGRENDGTGLYFYRARMYDAVQGRFLQEDPIGIAGGINIYVYAGNDPIGGIDPLGLADSTREVRAPRVGVPGNAVALNFAQLWELLKPSLSIEMVKRLLDEVKRKESEFEESAACGPQNVMACWRKDRPLGTVIIMRASDWISPALYDCSKTYVLRGRGDCCPMPVPSLPWYP